MVIVAKKVTSGKIVTEEAYSEKEGRNVAKTKIENVTVEGLSFEELSGVENKCAELQVDFAEGEDLFVISSAKFNNGVVSLDDVVYVIKEVALEDFTARLIKNSSKPE